MMNGMHGKNLQTPAADSGNQEEQGECEEKRDADSEIGADHRCVGHVFAIGNAESEDAQAEDDALPNDTDVED